LAQSNWDVYQYIVDHRTQMFMGTATLCFSSLFVALKSSLFVWNVKGVYAEGICICFSMAFFAGLYSVCNRYETNGLLSSLFVLSSFAIFTLAFAGFTALLTAAYLSRYISLSCIMSFGQYVMQAMSCCASLVVKTSQVN
jgi:drug/metabolite transporter (DMT)-like permease